MNEALSHEEWLDFMDNMDAFGVKVSGPRGELFVLAFSDGIELFGKLHWEQVMKEWDEDILEVSLLPFHSFFDKL